MFLIFSVGAGFLIFAVASVLVSGLLNMFRAGSSRVSNKLMQLRIFLQFVAIIFIFLAFLWRMPIS